MVEAKAIATTRDNAQVLFKQQCTICKVNLQEDLRMIHEDMALCLNDVREKAEKTIINLHADLKAQ